MSKKLTWEELSLHNKKGDYYIAIEGKVYDISTYLAEHPGGDDILIKYAGGDATAPFVAQNHSDYAISLRNARLIGTVEGPVPELKKIDSQKGLIEYTYEDVAKHNTPEDCWIVIHKKIYDPISFLNDHPGGPTVITNRAGKDCTKAFDEVGHTETAQLQMKPLIVGVIKEGCLPPEGEDEGASDKLSISQVLLLVAGLVIGVVLFYVFNN